MAAAAAAPHADEYDIDFDEEHTAPPSSSSYTSTLPPSSPSPTSLPPPLPITFEKTLVSPLPSHLPPPPLPRRVSFPDPADGEYRLSPISPTLSATLPFDPHLSSSPPNFTYSASPAFNPTASLPSPYLPRPHSLPPPLVPPLSLSSLSRVLSTPPPPAPHSSSPLYHVHVPLSSRSPLPSSRSSSPSTSRASRIQHLLSEFDAKFLVTDPHTHAQHYPAWAVPYAREMLDKLEHVRRMDRTDTQRRQREEGEGREGEVKGRADHPTLHARYDSILDQYYPDKHAALHNPVRTSSPSPPPPRTRKATAHPSPTRASSSTAHSNCVGHSHGRHSTAGTEDGVGQRIRVTKLHSAMAEQINLLSGSLKEVWQRVEGWEEEGRRREADLMQDHAEGIGRMRADVEEEVRGMKAWREWNRSRMQELVEAMQRVVGEQEEGQARVALIQAEQVELRGRYEEARGRMEEVQARYERDARAWEERERAMQGRDAHGREEVERFRRERDDYQHHLGLAQQRLQDMQQRMRVLDGEREATLQQLGQLKDGHEGARKALLDQLAALQQHTQQLQAKTQQLETSHADLSSTHSSLREQHSSLSSTHTTLLSNHSTLTSQHAATATLLSSYQSELQQAQKSQSDLQAMLKLEGEQVRTWRDQCEQLEAKLRDTEATTKLREAEVQARLREAEAAQAKADADRAAQEALAKSARRVSVDVQTKGVGGAAAAVQAVVPRLMSSHYKRRLQQSQAELQASAQQLQQREAELRQLRLSYDEAVAAHSSHSSTLLSQLQSKQSELDALHSTHTQHVHTLHAQLLTTDALNAELASFVTAVKPQLPSLALSSTLIAGFRGDYLHAHSDPQLLAMIYANGDRTVVFSDHVSRWDSGTHALPRLMVVTEACVYLCKEKVALLDIIHGRGAWKTDKDMRRCIRLENVTFVAASPSRAGMLVLHVNDKYDYLLETPKRQEVVYWLMKTFEAKVGRPLRVEWSDELYVRDRGQKTHREVKVVASEKAEIGKKHILTPAALNEVKQ